MQKTSTITYVFVSDDAVKYFTWVACMFTPAFIFLASYVFLVLLSIHRLLVTIYLFWGQFKVYSIKQYKQTIIYIYNSLACKCLQ